MDIIKLINEWYYLGEYSEEARKMYLKGLLDIGTYKEIRKDYTEVQSKLFKILEEDYNIKDPYIKIPFNLNHVLNIVS